MWDEFDIFQQARDRKPQFEIGRKEPFDAKIYVNPIKEAMRYQTMLDSGEVKSRAELARKLRVSRAKVTQMPNLLKLDSEVLEFLAGLDETDERLGRLTERKLRSLMQMSGSAQRSKFWQMVDFRTENLQSGVG